MIVWTVEKGEFVDVSRSMHASLTTQPGSPLDEIDRLERELAAAKAQRDEALEHIRAIDCVVRKATFTGQANL